MGNNIHASKTAVNQTAIPVTPRNEYFNVSHWRFYSSTV